MKKIANIAVLSVLAAALHSAYGLNLTNQSPFYLHLQSGDASQCQATIAPGATGVIADKAYCGYDACATNDFNSSGCMEVTNGNTGNNTLTQGGYATYLGINTYGANPVCSIAWPFIPYLCSIDTSGSFSLVYKSITQVYSGGPDNGKPVTIPAVTKYAQAPYFRGVNISGLEYDGTMLDALFQHPDLPDVRYFAAQGMNFVRLPIRAEFVFGSAANPVISTNPDPNAAGEAPNNIYLGAVYDTVEKYLASGISVQLDLHNYMRFCPTGPDVGQGNEPTDPVNNKCSVMTADQLASIWSTIMNTEITIPGVPGTVTFANLAQKYAPGNSNGGELILGVMNEPFSQSDQVVTTASIFANEVAAVKAIRASAPNNLILLSGNGWDPLHLWLSTETDDSTTFTKSRLEAQGLDTTNLAIEVHQYFDSNYSGTNQACNQYASQQAFLEDMGVVDASGTDIFKAWMQQNNMRVMLTEFGGADNVYCRQDMNWMLQYMQDDAYDSAAPKNGGFIGWAAWRANRNSSGGFNFLQQADQTVYGAPASGTTGIVQGTANGLMSDVFGAYLIPPAAK